VAYRVDLLSDVTDHAMEDPLAEEKLSRTLVLADLTESDHTRTSPLALNSLSLRRRVARRLHGPVPTAVTSLTTTRRLLADSRIVFASHLRRRSLSAHHPSSVVILLCP
jgi:hypothetical protein